MMRKKDYTGERFGMLTVLSYSKTIKGHKYYKCQCDCGNIKDISGSHLVTGASKSCGCMVVKTTIKRSTTHGQSHTRLFSIWQGMKDRCYNSNSAVYKYYGKRGITISDEWKNDFSAFQKWSMEHGYSDDLSIERIDVNGNYDPSNCEWITLKDQAKNRTTSRYITINGITKQMIDWCKESPVTTTTVYKRIRDGWNVIDALTKPDQRKTSIR